MRDAPRWAFTIVEAECQAAGIPLPALHWSRNRATRTSGGTTSRTRGIRIRAGRDYRDQKMVLLHELAHWLLFCAGGNADHDARFWDIAFGLYKKYRLGRYAVGREETYKIGAIWAAARAGIITRRDAEHRNAVQSERYLTAARRR